MQEMVFQKNLFSKEKVLYNVTILLVKLRTIFICTNLIHLSDKQIHKNNIQFCIIGKDVLCSIYSTCSIQFQSLLTYLILF